MLCSDEGVHPKPDTRDPDGAAALWLGLCVWCCRSCCLLSFRGIKDHWQVIVKYRLLHVSNVCMPLSVNYGVFSLLETKEKKVFKTS